MEQQEAAAHDRPRGCPVQAPGGGQHGHVAPGRIVRDRAERVRDQDTSRLRGDPVGEDDERLGDLDPAYPGLVARGRLQVGPHQFGQPLGEQPHQVVDTVRIRLVHEPDRPVTGGQGLGSLPLPPAGAQAGHPAQLPGQHAGEERAHPQGRGCGRDEAEQARGRERRGQRRRHQAEQRRPAEQDKVPAAVQPAQQAQPVSPGPDGRAGRRPLQDRVPAVVLLGHQPVPRGDEKQDGQRRTRPDQADDTSRAHRGDRAGTERCGADVRGGLPRLRE